MLKIDQPNLGDHGYAAMKSKNFSFPTGLVGHEYEPYTQNE